MNAANAVVLEEIDEAIQHIAERRDEMLAKLSEYTSELQGLRTTAQQGGALEEIRVKVRATRRRALGAEEKKPVQTKPQDMRVRMRAPTDHMGNAPMRMKNEFTPALTPRMGLSRAIVQGSIQRELQAIEARIVELLMSEKEQGANVGGEVCFLVDLRAGLQSLVKEMPEHDVLLGLVQDHLDEVQAVGRDLVAGGLPRARRFFDHDRELLGRYRAMLRVEGQVKGAAAAGCEKMAQTLARLRESLDKSKGEAGASGELAKVARELEDTLLVIHRELSDRGFVAARSVLFSALRQGALA